MRFRYEAAVKGMILVGLRGEVQIIFLLLDDEDLLLVFVDFDHEIRRVELVDRYSADKGFVVFVLGNVLVQIFLLHIFLDVVEVGLHAFCVD